MSSPGHLLFLGLGSNLGDRRQYLLRAVRDLQSGGLEVLRCSSLYATAPWGRTDQPAFLNMALSARWTGDAPALLGLCQAVERAAGRVRDLHWGPRTLDIDLLDFGGTSLNLPDLVLPHPQLAARAFVLAPLLEIAPDMRPGGGPAVRELWQQIPLQEQAGVTRLMF